MKTTLTPIEKIIPYDRNPRDVEPAVDAVAESIREFGFRQPIVVDADYVIVVGHVRYFAAIRLGLDKVPVHIAKDLTPDQVRAYRLADNKTNELAGWDNELLAQEILALTESEIDLTAYGFDQTFLDGLGEQVSAEISKNKEGGSQQLSLKFGKYSVPLDETEYNNLVALLSKHEQTTGTRFVFIAMLLESNPSLTTDPTHVPPELSPVGAAAGSV